MWRTLVLALVPATAWSGTLVSHWTFDGDALDSVGGNNGTVLGTAHYSAGVAGQAIDFDALGAGVQVNAILGATGTAPFTVSLWTKYDGTFSSGGAVAPVLSAGATAEIIDRLTVGRTGYPTAFARIGGVDIGAAFDEADQAWHHVVIQRSSRNLTTYVDGVLSNSMGSPNVTIANDGPHYFGYDALNNFTLPGQIDDVQVYDYALTLAEVQALYNAPGVDLGDLDADGVLNAADNCIGVANVGQEDANADGFGDACASPRAIIDPSVTHYGEYIGAKATVGANATLGAGALMGRRSALGAGATLGPGVVVGRASTVGVGTSIGTNSVLGYAATVASNVTIGAGVRVGNLADVWAGSAVGDNSRIGRAARLDGGTSGPWVGTGVKIGPDTVVSGDLAPVLTLGNDVVIRRGSVVARTAQVGDLVTISRNVVICYGTIVGAGAVIRSGNNQAAGVAAGAVVPRGTHQNPCR